MKKEDRKPVNLYGGIGLMSRYSKNINCDCEGCKCLRLFNPAHGDYITYNLKKRIVIAHYSSTDMGYGGQYDTMLLDYDANDEPEEHLWVTESFLVHSTAPWIKRTTQQQNRHRVAVSMGKRLKKDQIKEMQKTGDMVLALCGYHPDSE